MEEYLPRNGLLEEYDRQHKGPPGGARKIMETFPSADVRHVVKAHWTDHRTNEHDGEWYCSACGKAITIYMGIVIHTAPTAALI